MVRRNSWRPNELERLQPTELLIANLLDETDEDDDDDVNGDGG